MLHPAINILLSPGYCPEAKDYFSRLPNSLDGPRKKLIDTFIRTLVDGGVWSKLDVLYLFANTDAANAVVNLLPVASAEFNAIPVNSPTHTADRGFLGANSGTKHVRTGFTPSTAGGKFTQNSGSMFIYSRTAGSNLSYIGAMPSGGGTGATSILLSSSKFYTALNCTKDYVQSTLSTYNSSGLICISRTAAAMTRLYQNGVKIGENTRSSDALTAYELYIHGLNNAGSTGTINAIEVAVWGCGGGLTDGTDTILLYQAINQYLTDIGANM